MVNGVSWTHRQHSVLPKLSQSKWSMLEWIFHSLSSGLTCDYLRIKSCQQWASHCKHSWMCLVRPYFPLHFSLMHFSSPLLTPTSSTSCKNTHRSQNSVTWISPKHCDKTVITDKPLPKSKAFLQHELVPFLDCSRLSRCCVLGISIAVGSGNKGFYLFQRYTGQFQSFTADLMY